MLTERGDRVTAELKGKTVCLRVVDNEHEAIAELTLQETWRVIQYLTNLATGVSRREIRPVEIGERC